VVTSDIRCVILVCRSSDCNFQLQVTLCDVAKRHGSNRNFALVTGKSHIREISSLSLIKRIYFGGFAKNFILRYIFLATPLYEQVGQ
jgi:hypothetical protein